jgi:hypothetical protein
VKQLNSDQPEIRTQIVSFNFTNALIYTGLSRMLKISRRKADVVPPAGREAEIPPPNGDVLGVSHITVCRHSDRVAEHGPMKRQVPGVDRESGLMP